MFIFYIELCQHANLKRTFNLPNTIDIPAFEGSIDYSAGVNIATATSAATAFTVPLDGFIFASVRGTHMGETNLYINGVKFRFAVGNSLNEWTGSGFTTPVKKGDSCYVGGSLSQTALVFYPTKQVATTACIKY